MGQEDGGGVVLMLLVLDSIGGHGAVVMGMTLLFRMVWEVIVMVPVGMEVAVVMLIVMYYYWLWW